MSASKVPDVVHRAGVDGFGLRTFNRHDHPCVEQQPPAHFHRRTTERRHNGAIAARTRRRRISEQLSDPTEWTVRRSIERHRPPAHVVRCFEDPDVTHVENRIDPNADIETIETELMLADLDSLERRVDALEKKAKGSDKDAKEAREMLDLVNRSLVLLRDGKPARLVERKPEEERAFHMLGLLTSMPVLYVCNVDEASAATGNAFSRQVEARAKAEGAGCVVISAKIEAEIAVLSREERTEYLAAVGLHEAGLDRLINAGYALLDLVTYFTAGPKETRAWTITHGTKAPQAAGVIHTDFERGFIRAETIAYDDYVALGGEAGARDGGKLRLEGKDYVVADGDVMHFRFAT